MDNIQNASKCYAGPHTAFRMEGAVAMSQKPLSKSPLPVYRASTSSWAVPAIALGRPNQRCTVEVTVRLHEGNSQQSVKYEISIAVGFC